MCESKTFEEVFKKGGFFARVRVTVQVYPRCIIEDYIIVEIVETNHPDLKGAKIKSSNHRGISTSYPLCNVSAWENEQGKKCVNWFDELANGGSLIPTQKEINGGRTNGQVQRAKTREEVAALFPKK